MNRVILHVDMDAFFASVELLDHPEWRGKPVIVGSGPHERGVVSTCSYEARKFGVHSAMPSRTAYELCPHAIFAPPRSSRYAEVSAQAFEVFGHYSPFVEGVSIDEAFLDITGTIHLHGDARTLGENLRDEIRRTCGVTCSVGIAPNRLLAKIGSELHKPDGLTLMPFGADEIAAFLAPRPLGILWGVGKKTEAFLRPYGLLTCGDIQRMPLDQLATLLHSPSGAAMLHEYAFGRADDTVRWQEEEEKSVSREYTFPVDESNREVIRERLLQLVAEVGYRFRRERRWANTAKLKLRDASFATITRQMPFDAPSRDDHSFRQKALELFEREPTGTVRLIGFGVTNLQFTPTAPTLFPLPTDTDRERQERLSTTLDNLRQQGLLPT